MNCTERDADILMLVHGESDWLAQVRTHFHLLVCPSCRARYQQFAHASQFIATGSGNGGTHTGIRSRPDITPLFVVGLLVLTLLVGITVVTVRMVTPPPKQVPSTPCIPDLKSDHCR